MSKKIEDLVKEMVMEENDWRGHVKKHLKAHPKGDLGKMSDEETKDFFKKAKSSYGKGHSDEEIKKMHNGNEKEEPKEESKHLGIALMIYEQIINLRTRNDVGYSGEIKELKNDLISLGYTEEMCKMFLNNKIYLGEIEDPSKIKVENPGILEVPEGKDVESLPASHFTNLAQKKGREPVVKALMNLYRWNKGKGGEKGKLADWAKGMQEKVSASMEKSEKE